MITMLKSSFGECSFALQFDLADVLIMAAILFVIAFTNFAAYVRDDHREAIEKMLTMKMPRIPPKHKKDVSHVNFTKLMPPLAVFQVENSVPDSPSSLTEANLITAPFFFLK